MNVGDTVTWMDVQGRTRTGEVLEVRYVIVKVRTAEGHVLELSIKPEPEPENETEETIDNNQLNDIDND